MKKLYLLFTGVIAFIFAIANTNAAPNASISVSRATIENGQSVTATVRITNVAAWNLRINSSGNTSGCAQSFVDATPNGADTTKTFSVTCKSTNIGSISFSMSGDATSASDGATINIAGSKTVSVVAPTPKSANNNLASLSVEGAEISPTFNANTTEYTVVLPAETKTIKINATKADNKATISGSGDINLVEGANKITITVTAENGSSKTYTISATVKELDPIKVSVNGKDYTVVRKIDELTKPESFIEKNVKIDDEEVPGFYSEIVNYTLVGLKDSSGKIKLYIYDETKKTYTLYEELKFKGITFISKNDTKNIPSGYKKSTITINDIEVKCYKNEKNKDFVIVYGLDVESGYEGLFTYDTKYETLQRYNEIAKDNNISNIIIYSLGGTLFISLIINIVQVVKLNKRKKKKIAI